jgi:hypothetical protein
VGVDEPADLVIQVFIFGRLPEEAPVTGSFEDMEFGRHTCGTERAVHANSVRQNRSRVPVVRIVGGNPAVRSAKSGDRYG